jgi:hypothetical protein
VVEILEMILAFFASVFITIFDIFRYIWKYYIYREKKARKRMIEEYPQLKRMDE